jgi:hypothetical protein
LTTLLVKELLRAGQFLISCRIIRWELPRIPPAGPDDLSECVAEFTWYHAEKRPPPQIIANRIPKRSSSTSDK